MTTGSTQIAALLLSQRVREGARVAALNLSPATRAHGLDGGAEMAFAGLVMGDSGFAEPIYFPFSFDRGPAAPADDDDQGPPLPKPSTADTLAALGTDPAELRTLMEVN